MDITDRKQAEEALKESVSKYRDLVETSQDLIWRTDWEGRFTYLNPAWESTLGFSLEAMIGHEFSDFKRPDEREQNIQRHHRTMQSNQATNYETTYISKTGAEIILNFKGKPLFDASGQIVGTQGTATDITERKKAEEELSRHRDQLEEIVAERTRELHEAQEQLVGREKLAVLGLLAGGVGHELRNPLGAIKTSVYFLDMALENPEPDVKETLEVLSEEVTTSERIIGSLLDFARPKPPTRQNVDINDIVQRALDRASFPETIETAARLDEALPPILTDPDQVSQAFGNIILNAIQAMPDGGRLDVQSEVPAGGWVAVSFSDTGAGIPQENLAQLFEPLFTTKARGIGLGLALTKTLVEGQGGTIEVSSEVGKGSTFTILLPAGSKEKKN